jgi:HSP20 family protein
VGSSFDVDVTFALAPAVGPQRQECFAPWRPPIEVFETERELFVRAEIGGLSGDDVEVLAEGDRLVIRGTRQIARHDDHRVYHESRVRYGPFEASIRLPFPVDIPAATADYVDGFLTVSLPRLSATKVVTRGIGTAGSA